MTNTDITDFIKCLAKQGEAQSQCRLGNKYRLGQGVEQDYKQAVYWYKKSAEQGNEQVKKTLQI